MLVSYQAGVQALTLIERGTSKIILAGGDANISEVFSMHSVNLLEML